MCSDDSSRETEFSLQRYESVMAHLRYDQEIFWERFGFMMVAEVAALGIFFGLFLETVKDANLAKMKLVVSVLVAFCIVGLAIVWRFKHLLGITSWWISRWLKILESIEHSAFGDIDVFRNAVPPGSARTSARHFINMFTAIWAILIVVVLSRWLA